VAVAAASPGAKASKAGSAGCSAPQVPSQPRAQEAPAAAYGAAARPAGGADEEGEAKLSKKARGRGRGSGSGNGSEAGKAEAGEGKEDARGAASHKESRVTTGSVNHGDGKSKSCRVAGYLFGDATTCACWCWRALACSRMATHIRAGGLRAKQLARAPRAHLPCCRPTGL